MNNNVDLANSGDRFPSKNAGQRDGAIQTQPTLGRKLIQQVDRNSYVPAPPVNEKPVKKANRKRRNLLCKLFLCSCFRDSGSNLFGVGYAEATVPSVTESVPKPKLYDGFLLPPLQPGVKKKTLVLDLDETLVHSSFIPITNPDFLLRVEMEGHLLMVYVKKRPHVDQFLQQMKNHFELVVFTASLAKYADPLLDMLDTKGIVDHRLFREACFVDEGQFVKDLTQLGRNLKDIIIVDNSPWSYKFQPQHAIPVSSWFDDMEDVELGDLIRVLFDISKSDDVTVPIARYVEKYCPVVESESYDMG